MTRANPHCRDDQPPPSLIHVSPGVLSHPPAGRAILHREIADNVYDFGTYLERFSVTSSPPPYILYAASDYCCRKKQPPVGRDAMTPDIRISYVRRTSRSWTPATRRRSARRATTSPGASSSASAWRGRSTRTRTSCSSTTC